MNAATRRVPFARRRWGDFARLMRLHRPIGILLLLWPTLWALWLASEGLPDPWLLSVFLLGTVLMRSAGCVINDYADRHFDGHVSRTRERPLVTHAVTEREALVLFGILVALSAGLVFTLNLPTLLLSFAAVGLAMIYPFMKRHTHLPQVFLGAAFGWAVPMAFTAVTGELPPLAWLVFCAVVLWVLVYDTEYAMTDRADDLRIGIRSTAILLADLDRPFIALAQALMVLDLIMIGRQSGLGLVYGLGLACAAGLFVYQQWLIRQREPAACLKAFLNNQWAGLAIFIGIAADYALRAAQAGGNPIN